jgi:hypothetical protein
MFFTCSRMSLSVIANGNFVDCALARSSHDGKRRDIALPDAVGFSMDTKRGKWTLSGQPIPSTLYSSAVGNQQLPPAAVAAQAAAAAGHRPPVLWAYHANSTQPRLDWRPPISTPSYLYPLAAFDGYTDLHRNDLRVPDKQSELFAKSLIQ